MLPVPALRARRFFRSIDIYTFVFFVGVGCWDSFLFFRTELEERHLLRILLIVYSIYSLDTQVSRQRALHFASAMSANLPAFECEREAQFGHAKTTAEMDLKAPPQPDQDAYDVEASEPDMAAINRVYRYVLLFDTLKGAHV